MSRSSYKFLIPVGVGVVVLALWTWAHNALGPDRQFILPTPRMVYAAFQENRSALLHAAWNTSRGAVIGFGSAAIVSFALALILSLSKWVRAGLYPYLMILQMTPIIVFAPMLVIWVGPGLKSVSVITFLICFFPLVVNTTQGLVSTDQNLVELFRMYRSSRIQELWLLRVPSALPYFFTGLRIAATLAPIGALVGDYTAGSSAHDGGGLGFQTLIYSFNMEISALFATAAVTCALGFILVALVVILSWLALHKWHDSYERTDK